MKTPVRRIAAALAVGLSATALFAQGRKNPQAGTEYWMKLEKELGLQTRYTVDMEVQAMGMAMPSKVYRLDGRTRTETTMPFMNLRMIVLQLEEAGKPVGYILFPDKKKYCLNEEAAEAAAQPADVKVTEAGTEAYEGVTCKKRRVTVKMPDGQTQELDMLFSPAQKNMPVKMSATVKIEQQPGQEPMTVTSEVFFKNYVFQAPDAGLFAIPKDYVRAKDMQEIMMGSMGGFMMPQQPAAAGQAGGAQAAPDLGALLRQAQAEAAKEEAAAKPEAPAAPPANLQQNLQNLRRLLGN